MSGASAFGTVVSSTSAFGTALSGTSTCGPSIRAPQYDAPGVCSEPGIKVWHPIWDQLPASILDLDALQLFV